MIVRTLSAIATIAVVSVGFASSASAHAGTEADPFPNAAAQYSANFDATTKKWVMATWFGDSAGNGNYTCAKVPNATTVAFIRTANPTASDPKGSPKPVCMGSWGISQSQPLKYAGEK